MKRTYKCLSDHTPDAILADLLRENDVVAMGEDHTDHSAKRFLIKAMPLIAESNASLALELVRSDNPGETEDLRPDQTMINRFIFQGDNAEAVETAIKRYCHDYGKNMLEETMGLLHSARHLQVPIIGIDRTLPSDTHTRIANANGHWERILHPYLQARVRKILMLVGKNHIHNINLYDETAGDQSIGIDKRLGAPSLVVHASDTNDIKIWKGSEGVPEADIEIRLPDSYFLSVPDWRSKIKSKEGRYADIQHTL